jgi:thioredoxin-related protein
MRTLAAVSLFVLLSSFSGWGTSFEKARQQASAEHKYILLNFSGSDWCGPCIRLHHEVFESAAFTDLADKKLVLVNADFPRQKKNQLSASLQKQNDLLADKYNPSGNFPLTVLLNADGNIVKQWEGFPKMSIAEFVSDLKNTIDAGK